MLVIINNKKIIKNKIKKEEEEREGIFFFFLIPSYVSSLTSLLTGFGCEIGLTGFNCFVVVLRWISWLCSGGFLWLCSGEFRGCEIEFVVVRVWVCGGVVSVGLWVCGGVVSVGLWVCGGWPVGAWWWLVVGLWRWGCGFGDRKSVV